MSTAHVPSEGPLSHDLLFLGLSTCSASAEQPPGLLGDVATRGFTFSWGPGGTTGPRYHAMLFQHVDPANGRVHVAVGVAFAPLSCEAASVAMTSDLLRWALQEHELLGRDRLGAVGAVPELILLRKGTVIEHGSYLF